MAVTFSHKNLLKDNPRNVERIAAGLRRVVAVAAGLSVIQHNEMLALWIIIGGAVLDEVKNFFGQVAADHEQVKVTFPADMADKVEVETGPADEPKQ